jgi:hypothetical protein
MQGMRCVALSGCSLDSGTILLTLQPFICSSFLSLPWICLLFLKWFILSWILIFCTLSWLYTAFHLLTNWHPLPLPLGLIVTIWMIQLHHYFFSWCQSLLLFLMDFGFSLAISWSYSTLPLWCHSFVWSCFALCSLFHCFLLMSSLSICMHCLLYILNYFNWHLLHVLSWSIHCMHTMPTECSVLHPHLAAYYSFIPICLGWIHQNVHLYPPQVLSFAPHLHGVK